MSKARPSLSYKKVARLFHALGQPARLKILMAIGGGEACVCHLEAALGMRQAYISQQLMALRLEDIVDIRREGRFIFYRLKDPELLALVGQAARLSGFAQEPVQMAAPTPILPDCSCPHCSGTGETAGCSGRVAIEGKAG
jgi:ArsR family transcriptional regulator